MKSTFHSKWPKGRFVNIDEDAAWHERVDGAEVIVLLYPDAIGIGFYKIERQIFSIRSKGIAVWALNGRRRYFPLTPSNRMRLLLRRVLEKSLLPELLIAIVFSLVTPFFLLFDWSRGRR